MEQRECCSTLVAAPHDAGGQTFPRAQGYHFKVVDTTNDGLLGILKHLTRSTYRQTVPYLFVDHRPVGGFAKIRAFDSSGVLDHLIRVSFRPIALLISEKIKISWKSIENSSPIHRRLLP